MAIIDNNVQNVKFLRNQTPFETRELARQALENNKSQAADGTALLARYTITDGQTTDVKTLVGFVAEVNSTKYVTIIDVEGASGDVETLREEINNKLGSGITSANTATAQLTALSGNNESTSAETSVEGAKRYADGLISTLDGGITAETGSYIVSVSEVDGKISGTTAELPTVTAFSETGKPIVAVAEDKGTISASAGTIDAQYVNIADSGEKFSAATVEGALAELNDKITDAIDGLDYTDTAVTGSYVSKVDEVNGVISVTRVALPSSADTAEAKKVVIAVAEDKGQIEVSRGSITSSAETIVLADTEDGGVNFEVNIDGVSIVQDPTSKKLKVADTALVQYVGDEDTIHISAVDAQNNKTVSSLLTISATTPTDSNVREQYNLVGASGNTIGATIKIYKDSALYNVYLGHVDDTLSDNTDPTSIVDGSGDTALCFIYHKEDGTYKLVTVNVEDFIEENEFASGITWDSGATKVRGVVDPTSETFLTVGADGFKLSGVQDAINAAVADLDATVNNNANSGHVAVEIVETDGKLVSVTVTEDDIASADDIEELSGKTITNIKSTNSSIDIATANTSDGTVEVDVITDADKIQMSGFTAGTSGFTAITEASTVTEAVKAIETAVIANEEVTAAAINDLKDRVDTISGDVEDIEGKYLSGVSVNGNAVAVANHVATLSVSASTSAMTATSTEAIVVETDASGNITLGISSIDCGYYS